MRPRPIHPLNVGGMHKTFSEEVSISWAGLLLRDELNKATFELVQFGFVQKRVRFAKEEEVMENGF